MHNIIHVTASLVEYKFPLATRVILQSRVKLAGSALWLILKDQKFVVQGSSLIVLFERSN